MADILDAHGQPLVRAYNRKQRHDRTLDELLGLAKGMAADGVINQQEAEFLKKWLIKNSELNTTWPVNVINSRVNEMLCDGVLDESEQQELLELVCSFTGQIPVEQELENMASTLPLDTPPPSLTFNGSVYCFTGKFVSGTRNDCHQTTIQMGGDVKTSVSRKIDFLVIGVIGSRDWVHTSYGRKIEYAAQLREEGHGVCIVSEDHWAKHVYGTESY
ncbi:MAG: BRCT domain-containing protein [Desulfarculaceae bacterium]|nr:BRCT domain-containing protein [Desulfarculaceae bacterium]MCF8072386.1 BRCT domain-containing protein [Desulfarculaceae bacterium]MCF8100307.1 BRCT domain-containing protein [Desulfarculaceae bacterium]MCF8116120.1 BRCT domain-containing protein [Desulfarculaceae bacterium]